MASTPRWLERSLGADAAPRLEAAVREAESHTSAELVVVVRNASTPLGWLGLSSNARAVRRQAEKLFVKLELDHTRARNAVLVYVSVRERAVVVLGDLEIHQRLGASTWEGLVAEALGAAGSPGLLERLEGMVRHLGEKMAKPFPRAADDVNELPDAPNLR
jgi:uncharacterized membrane protein